jgi:hypothetical protein
MLVPVCRSTCARIDCRPLRLGEREESWTIAALFLGGGESGLKVYLVRHWIDTPPCVFCYAQGAFF